MAKVICNEHGGQVANLMCEHVAGAIWSGESIRYTPSLHPDLEGVWFCDQCERELAGLALDWDLEAFLGRIKPHCGACARAWRKSFPPVQAETHH
jgi:hypothetical protein